ncbi:extracellular solute-binding protein, partial [Listeria monocytogenes]|nr:extracellular solute-binding protein [Listeria monocytogenes]
VQYGASGMDWVPNWGVFIKSNGGSLVENNEVVINSPENLEVLTWFNNLYQDGYVGTYEFYESVAQSGADSMFSQGRIGMLTTGFWNIGNFTQLDDLNFDIAPMPFFNEKVTWPFGSALAISKQSTKQDAAFRFIEYMTSEEAQKILGESLVDSPANIKVLNSEEFTNRQVNGKDLRLDVVGISTERVVIDGIFEGPYYGELTGEFSNQVKEMLLGRLTPEEALEKMQESGEKIMEQY